MVKPTWEDRDLPVLRAVVEEIERTEKYYVDSAQIQEASGFDENTVKLALWALNRAQPPLLGETSDTGDGTITIVAGVTERARRAIGLWPTAEDLADRFVRAFDQAAEEAQSEEQRGKLRQLGQGIAGVGRGVMVDVLAKIASKQLGLEP